MSKALVLAAVSAGVQLVGGIQSAKAAVKAAEFDAQQIQLQKDANQLEALQAEANERDELKIALATQEGQASGQNLDIGSGSFRAIQRDSRLKSSKNIKNIKLFGQIKAKQFTLGIEQTRQRGEEEASGAIFQALGNIASTGVSLAQTGAFDKKTTG